MLSIHDVFKLHDDIFIPFILGSIRVKTIKNDVQINYYLYLFYLTKRDDQWPWFISRNEPTSLVQFYGYSKNFIHWLNSFTESDKCVLPKVPGLATTFSLLNVNSLWSGLWFKLLLQKNIPYRPNNLLDITPISLSRWFQNIQVPNSFFVSRSLQLIMFSYVQN